MSTTPVLRPNDVAEAITGRRHVSWSQIQMYRQCPARFRLHYIEHVKPAFVPSSLALGGAIHEALALFYQRLMEGAAPSSAEPFVARFMEAWDEATEGIAVQYTQKETPDSVLDLGRRMIEAFVASPESRVDGRVLGIEEEMAGPIADDLPDLLARLDLVTIDEGVVSITDFKTAACRWNPDKLLEHGGQLQLYGDIAGRTGLASGALRLRFAVLTKAAQPVVQLLEVPHDEAGLERTKEGVREVWSAITAGVFPARPGWVCRPCPFRGSCDAVGG